MPLACESVLSPNEIVIEIKQEAVPRVAIEVALLTSELAESVRLQPSSGSSVSLEVREADRASKAIVTCAADASVVFAIGRNQVEYLQAVLLRCYRDQMAEVNHVHIEGDRSGAPFDLTIMFDTYREPMSAEQAETLLRESTGRKR
jgi:hypothetical protein